MKKNRFKNTLTKIKTFPSRVLQLISYMFLITIYLILLLVRKVTTKLKFLSGLQKSLENLMYKLDKPKPKSVYKVELIDLALENMASKRKRTIITIGGMTIGIASIVFLVSIGYGLQSLVVNRVARLDELKQTEVSILPGSNLLINDEIIESFESIEDIKLVLPQISVVGKVNYNNSQTDTAVYAVTKDYLEQSAISPVTGTTFESNETSTDFIAKEQELTEEDIQKNEELPYGWVEVEGESDLAEELNITKVIFPEEITDKEVVVNRAFLRVLNLKESNALDETFTVSFIATSKSLIENQDRLESNAIEYTIVGVTPDEETPLVYVPFTHLKALGIENYSQLKIVVKDDDVLGNVRQQIEASGYATSSVVDTVEQINDLFTTATLVLASLGTIALLVAALGMVNTLTVSLLERIREVGLLKTMGMKSNEIRDLFLAESMIMGSSGGFLGLLLGLATGKLLEIGISVYAVSQNVGTVSIVDIPIPFALLVIFLSFVVGIFTGIYPAKQATEISALNALRYE